MQPQPPEGDQRCDAKEHRETTAPIYRLGRALPRRQRAIWKRDDCLHLGLLSCVHEDCLQKGCNNHPGRLLRAEPERLFDLYNTEHPFVVKPRIERVFAIRDRRRYVGRTHVRGRQACRQIRF
jgi:hypothetical protein